MSKNKNRTETKDTTRTDRLNLTIDSQVSDSAKVYAERAGISVSRLVEGYLSAVTGLSGPSPKEASQEEIRDLMNFTGKVLTADGHIFQATKPQQEMVAYLNTMELIINQDGVLSPEVFAVESAIRRAGYGIGKKLIVSKEILEILYGENTKISEDFQKPAKKILTIEGGPIKLTEEQRKFVLLFEDGTLLSSNSLPLHPSLFEGLHVINKSGINIKVRKTVDLDTIARLYEKYASQTFKNAQIEKEKKQSYLQTMQYAFIDFIKSANEDDFSEVHFHISRYESTIRGRKNGVMQFIKNVESHWAYDLCAAAFNMADTSDSSYRPLEYQRAKISDIRTPLPEGVGWVILHFAPLPNGGRYLFCDIKRDQIYPEINLNEPCGVFLDTYKMPGLHIVYGKPCSGKTTFLGRFLSNLPQELNIVAVQDPLGFKIPNVSQLPVLNAQTDVERNEKFRQALSAAIRLRPDVMMVSGIHDSVCFSLIGRAIESGITVYAEMTGPSFDMINSQLKRYKDDLTLDMLTSVTKVALVEVEKSGKSSRVLINAGVYDGKGNHHRLISIDDIMDEKLAMMSSEEATN